MVLSGIAADESSGKLYQRRARAALPLLVHQAHAGAMPISYEALASELCMPNPRNLNYVLGAIGITRHELSQKWNERIPLLEALVVNKATRLPGDGLQTLLFCGLVPDRENQERRYRKYRDCLTDIAVYANWERMLREVNLSLLVDGQDVVSAARRALGGEGAAHLELKSWVIQHPHFMGNVRPPGEPELKLASGDRLDVSFMTPTCWTGVEVKPEGCPDEDVRRGLFQVVKYEAVMRAELRAKGERCRVRVVLALGGTLPTSFRRTANALGVEVFENVGRDAVA